MIELKQELNGIAVNVDGKPFTRFITAGLPKIALYPVLTPSGANAVRDLEDPEAKKEHPHHRGIWCAHGAVNGVDFWEEYKPEHGKIVHRSVEKMQSGAEGFLNTTAQWVDFSGKAILNEKRAMRFFKAGKARGVEIAIGLTSATGVPVEFGDTKEGGLAAVRVAPRMNASKEGIILNAEGLSYGQGAAGGEPTWGKRSKWVSYSGPVGAGSATIAILDLPGSFRHPTHWHVRGYGLFAANPFGISFFENAIAGKDRDLAKSGAYTLPAGQTLKAHHVVLVADGELTAPQIEEIYRQIPK